MHTEKLKKNPKLQPSLVEETPAILVQQILNEKSLKAVHFTTEL